MLAVIAMFLFWFFYLRASREKMLLKQGNYIVSKVEEYKKEYHRLPDSLAEIGIKENSETETHISYQKQDSIHYYVWIAISAEASKFYYSDSKKWESILRDMK